VFAQTLLVPRSTRATKCGRRQDGLCVLGIERTIAVQTVRWHQPCPLRKDRVGQKPRSVVKGVWWQCAAPNADCIAAEGCTCTVAYARSARRLRRPAIRKQCLVSCRLVRAYRMA
jgi:hypothetical protein